MTRTESEGCGAEAPQERPRKAKPCRGCGREDVGDPCEDCERDEAAWAATDAIDARERDR